MAGSADLLDPSVRSYPSMTLRLSKTHPPSRPFHNFFSFDIDFASPTAQSAHSDRATFLSFPFVDSHPPPRSTGLERVRGIPWALQDDVQPGAAPSLPRSGGRHEQPGPHRSLLHHPSGQAAALAGSRRGRRRR